MRPASSGTLLFLYFAAAPSLALQCRDARIQLHARLRLLPPQRWLPSRTAPVLMASDQLPSVSKQALVDAIALKAGVSKKTASMVLGATLDVVVESVCDGHKVSLVGFGSFQSKLRPEREVRNPKTGEKMLVKEAYVPSFSFGKNFKDAVKESGETRGL